MFSEKSFAFPTQVYNSFKFIRELQKLIFQVHYDIAQFWPGGFQAKVTIVLKHEIKFGWIMKLGFTSPVTSIEIFDAQIAVISEDSMVYVLKHQNYNAQLQTHQGQVAIFFTGTQPDGISGRVHFLYKVL
jgi:hypothetical protein